MRRAGKHNAVLVPRIPPDLHMTEPQGLPEDARDRARLVVSDFECDEGVRCEDALAGEECGDGAVKGEAVLAWVVGCVADEGAGVLVVPDGGGEGGEDVGRNVGRVCGDDVKGGWGVETAEEEGVEDVAQERSEYVSGGSA